MKDEPLIAVLDEVRALREQVAALDAKLDAIAAERKDARPTLRAQDTKALRRLLPVIRAQLGDGHFAVWELFDHARMPDVGGHDMKLALGSLSSGQVGRLFARAARLGVEVDGCAIRRGRTARGVAAWFIPPLTPLRGC